MIHGHDIHDFSRVVTTVDNAIIALDQFAIGVTWVLKNKAPKRGLVLSCLVRAKIFSPKRFAATGASLAMYARIPSKSCNALGDQII
jgi:hypothetical protein